MTVSADELIRRFLVHTLPTGFQRIRYFGFMANRFRKEKLELCRKLLSNPITELLPAPGQRREGAASPGRQPPGACPKCGTGLLIRVTLPVYRWPAKPPDTS